MGDWLAKAHGWEIEDDEPRRDDPARMGTVMDLRAEVERLRAERDEVRGWLRQWRDDDWRPATPGHDWLDEWLEAEEGK